MQCWSSVLLCRRPGTGPTLLTAACQQHTASCRGHECAYNTSGSKQVQQGAYASAQPKASQAPSSQPSAKHLKCSRLTQCGDNARCCASKHDVWACRHQTSATCPCFCPSLFALTLAKSCICPAPFALCQRCAPPCWQPAPPQHTPCWTPAHPAGMQVNHNG